MHMHPLNYAAIIHVQLYDPANTIAQTWSSIPKVFQQPYPSILLQQTCSASMSSAMIDEVKSAINFFKERSDHPHPATIATSFAANLISRISSSLTLSTKDATDLLSVLKDSPYDDASMVRITAAIDAKLVFSTMSHTVKDQFLKEWWHYLTADDMTFIKDPKHSFHAKMTKIVERANLLGCTHPSQQTLKWMMAMLLMCHYKDIPTSSEVYEKLQDLKQVILCERKPYPLAGLRAYPATPEELPAEVFAYAYADGKPVPVVMPGIASIAEGKIPLRSGSRLLKAIKTKPEQVKTDHVKLELASHTAAPCSSVDMPSRSSVDMPTQGDSFEEQLYFQYKAALWKHRAERQGILQLKSAPPEVKQELAMMVHTGASPPKHGHAAGHAHPIMLLSSATPLALADSSTSAKVMLLKPKAEDTKDEESSDLDEFAKAAIKAMTARTVTKKEEASIKKKADSLVKRPAKAEADIAKPAAKAAKAKASAKVKPTSKACHAKVKAGKVTAEGHTSKAVMPKDTSDGSNPLPVHYGGGVIYTVQAQKIFRALKVKGDRYTEYRKTWGKAFSKAEAWSLCLTAIDDYRKPVCKKAKKE